MIRWFRLARLLDAAAATDMLAWENSGFSVDASVRITLLDHDVPSYFRSLEHLISPPRRGSTGIATTGYSRRITSSGPPSRIARAKLMARVGEEFPLECPNCGGDIRLSGDGWQETAHFEPDVRKRAKARMASPAAKVLLAGLFFFPTVARRETATGRESSLF